MVVGDESNEEGFVGTGGESDMRGGHDDGREVGNAGGFDWTSTIDKGGDTV